MNNLRSENLEHLFSEDKQSRMSRRQMLNTLARTGAALGALTVGGSVITACSNTSEGPGKAESVTLLLADWPVKSSLITGNKKPADADEQAEQEVLKEWLAKNKNVSFKNTAIDLGDPNRDQKLQAAIAARTVPNIVGTFGNVSLNRGAQKLKFAANVTEQYKKYNVDSLLADYAKPLWEQTYKLGDQFYALPGDGVTAGAGLYYRRDLLKEKGIAEPEIGWTWDDFFALLRKFQQGNKPVMGAPFWMFGWMFNSNMLDPHPQGVLGSIPNPNNAWPWEVNVDPWLDDWKKLTEQYRKAVLDDKLIEQNETAYGWEGPAMGKYAAGQYPFSPGYAFQGTIPGYAPVTPIEMPKKFNKTFDELVGFIPYPKGSNGGYNTGVFPSMAGAVMFPSYLKGTALDKAVDLYLYMVYGDGYVNRYAKKYEITKDAKAAYKFIAPANKHQKNPKVPANVTVDTAFGEKWVKSYMNAIINFKPVPSMQLYFPPDKQTGPTDAAHKDMLDKLSQTKEDPTAILKKYQQTYNQQASTLKSDITKEEFLSSVKTYLGALDTYFKTNLPDFHAGDWTKYYTNYAQKNLS